jgi:hypothetical protein
MENEMKYKISKDIDIEIPKEMKSMSFQSFFTFLRKTLQIKYTRRIHIDSILKKCKGKFYKAINDCLRKCLKINIKKLPQVYITNISIDYNKCFFDFTVNDLYTYFNLMPYPMETILQREYCVKGKEDFFKYIFLSKINNLYLIFIESHRYKKEIELMKKQKGIKLAFLHQFVAENFINYYSYSKPHIRKNKLLENNGNNNNINNNNITNNYSNNKIYNIKKPNNNNSNLLFNINTIDNKNGNKNVNNEDKDNNINEIKENKKHFFCIEKLI